jgi:hypothetical protein
LKPFLILRIALESVIISKKQKEDFPNFKGSSDMESHFEFNMTPEEMRKYLISLGIEERRWK